MSVGNTTESAPKKGIMSVSEAAAQELKRLLTEDAQRDADGVRVAVKGGGCSGLSYVLEFDTMREGDNVHEEQGVRFYMDRKSSIYLKGILLDYRAGLHGKGFQFKNPNASSTCGCGESFSV